MGYIINGDVQNKGKIRKKGTTRYSKHVEALEKKIWFRFVKVAYILTFLGMAFFGADSIVVEEGPEKIVDKDESAIICDNGDKYSFEEIGETCTSCRELYSKQEIKNEYKEMCSDIKYEDIEKKIISEDETSWQKVIKSTRYELNEKYGFSLHERDIPHLLLVEVKKEFGSEIYIKEKQRRVEDEYKKEIEKMDKNYHVNIEYKNDCSWWIAGTLIFGYLILLVGVFFIVRTIFYYIIFGSNK